MRDTDSTAYDEAQEYRAAAQSAPPRHGWHWRDPDDQSGITPAEVRASRNGGQQ